MIARSGSDATSARLAFAGHLVVRVLSDDAMCTISERDGSRVHYGPAVGRIAGLIDGTRTEDDLVAACAGTLPAANVYYAIGLLRDAGVVDSVAQDLSPALQVRPALHVIAVGDTADDVRQSSERLEASGARIVDESSAHLILVLADDYRRPDLAGIADRLRAAGTPWLLAKPAGLQPWIGPLFTADAPCFHCLTHALDENAPAVVAAERAEGGFIPIAKARQAASRRFAVAVAVQQALAYVNESTGHRLSGRIFSADLRERQTAIHHVRRRPGCQACGEAVETPSPEVRLQTGLKRYTIDGGHRTVTPAETLERVAHLVSPITGIVPKVVAAGGGAALNVFHTMQRGPVRTGSQAKPRLGGGGAAGKGASRSQARASATAEAIERYCSYGPPRTEPRRARLEDLGGEAIAPPVLLNFSDRQYTGRDAWNAVHGPGFNWIPERFDPSREISWTPAWSLTAGARRWLPARYCYFGDDFDADHPFCHGDSNGCAAGNTLEEAILQGLFELVERDAMGIFWYNRVRRPAVALDPGDPFTDAMLAWHASHGRTLWALDLTTDLGIPVVLALSANAEGGRIAMGLGAHLEPRIALSRALSELNQMLAHADEMGADGEGDAARWIRSATLESEPYLRPADAAPMAGGRLAIAGDLRDDVHACVEMLAMTGLETIVLDLSRPDVDLCVVRVTVPGLRHFWARFAPGRLYEVPVKLGWLAEPVAEADLNPIPFML